MLLYDSGFTPKGEQGMTLQNYGFMKCPKCGHRFYPPSPVCGDEPASTYIFPKGTERRIE